MEITKKHWTIIGIVIGALAIYYFFIRKNKMSVESGYRKGGPPTPAPAPIEKCQYDGGGTCIKGTPYCRCGTLE